MDPMPEPGDLIAAFSPQPGRCFRMVQSRQLQANPLSPAASVEGHLDRPEGQGLVRRSLPGARAEGD